MHISWRKNQRGFALMYAIVGLVFVSTLFYFLSDYLVLLGRQSGKKVLLTQGRTVLHSLVDYTVFGIKQRWCFDEYWAPDSAVCNVTHRNSVERLLMSPDSLRIYNDMVRAGQIGGSQIQPLREIREVVDLERMLPAHPIYSIVQAARAQAPISRAEIVIERDRRPQMPVGGREMFLRLHIRILDSGNQIVKWQNLDMEIKADFAVFPRELGSYAMIVGRDLLMDSNYSANTSPGDVALHQFGSRSETVGWPGLTFESPVYVNRNLVLPSSPNDANVDDPRYAAVTFSDKVFLGAGLIMRGGTEFRPRSSGNHFDHLWNQVQEFGGFSRGIEIDGESDGGLNVLTGQNLINPIDENQNNLCRRMAAVRSRLEYTRSSHIAASYKGGDMTTGHLFRIGFSQENWVVPQRSGNTFGVADIDLNFMGNGRFYSLYNDANSNGNSGSSGNNGNNGNSGNRRRNNRASNMQSPSDAPGITMYPGRQVNPLSYRPNLSPRVPGLRIELAAARLLVPLSQALVDRLEAEIARLEEISRREALLVISVEPTVFFEAVQPNMFDLRVKDLKNENGLVDSEGVPLPFSVFVRGYDVGCENFDCREQRVSPDDLFYIQDPSFAQQGFLNFNVAGGQRTAPGGMSRNPNSNENWNDIPSESQNWSQLDRDCNNSTTSVFGGVDWAGASFLSSTFLSWNFAPPAPPATRRTPPSSQDYYDRGTQIVFDASNAVPRAPNINFHIQSLVDRCIIRSSATFVAGFLNCRHLEIQARTTPLRIIGTMILSKLTIDPSAYQAGIRWSSIYHPQATQELTQALVLGKNLGPGTSCDVDPNSPIWHPHPSLSQMDANFKCNVISLRNRAEPFTWTTVEPDCGLVTPTSRYSCKNRILKSIIYEVSRESKL